MIGGYNGAGAGATLSKSYTALPGHMKIRIVVDIFFLDTWDNE